MGMLYLAMEVVARAFRGELVTINTWSYTSLVGWSSIWMVFIGGSCALVIGRLNEGHKKMVLWLQCLIGCSFVFLVELLVGLLVNRVFYLNLWDYSSWPLNVCGQVTFLYIPVWFLLCPFVIFLDDVLQYVFFKGMYPESLKELYARLFTGR